MNKLNITLLLFLTLISGCKTTNIENNKTNQIIDNFDMNIYSYEGKKIFAVTSPHSSYENINNIFSLKETTIRSYKNNKIEYIINSDQSTFSNNNKLVELSGNVIVQKILQENEKLYADKFIWNTYSSEYLLIGSVKLENKSVFLNSNKAILNKENNIIEFFNPVKYIIKDNNNRTSFEINSKNAYYDIENKSVSFESKEERVRSKIYF